MKIFFSKYVVYIALVQAIVATLGSLYYSEIKHFAPCVLCWYQRIFMYPLIAIIAVGILRRDKALFAYVLPLSIIGQLVALYQVLLQARIIPESVAPCAIGVSCLTKYTDLFGFLSIPMLSFLAFSLITVCMLLYRNTVKKRYV